MGHDHGEAASGGRLAVALAITATVFVVELAGALATGSLALAVDAVHMLTDVLGLALAVTAARLMLRPPSDRHTWGFRRAEVLGALAQAALLLGVGVFAIVEGIRRLVEPPGIASTALLLFGIIGLVANLVSLAVLRGGRSRSLNSRAAFLEVANDALGSLGVIVAAILIAAFGWDRADAVVAILIALLIVPRTLVLLRASTSVLLEATPPGLDLAEVRRHLLELPDVEGVHDLHASLVSTDLPTLSAHVVIDDDAFAAGRAAPLLAELRRCVASHFPISVEHSTFQIEPASQQDEHPLHA